MRYGKCTFSSESKAPNAHGVTGDDRPYFPVASWRRKIRMKILRDSCNVCWKKYQPCQQNITNVRLTHFVLTTRTIFVYVRSYFLPAVLHNLRHVSFTRGTGGWHLQINPRVRDRLARKICGLGTNSVLKGKGASGRLRGHRPHSSPFLAIHFALAFLYARQCRGGWQQYTLTCGWCKQEAMQFAWSGLSLGHISSWLAACDSNRSVTWFMRAGKSC